MGYLWPEDYSLPSADKDYADISRYKPNEMDLLKKLNPLLAIFISNY
jgi:hypothetical protein